MRIVSALLARLTFKQGDTATYKGRPVLVLARNGWWHYTVDDHTVEALDYVSWWALRS